MNADFQARTFCTPWGKMEDRGGGASQRKNEFEAKPNYYYALCKYTMTWGTHGNMLVKNSRSYRTEI